jgi:RNA polymerase sigma factor (sigma-70 family)
VPSKETDSLQDVQYRVQLARQLFIEQGEFIRSIVRYATSNNEYTDDLLHDLFIFFVAKPIPKDIRNIRGYLYKVILDKVKDWQRARTRYQTKIRYYGQMNLKPIAVLHQEGQQREEAREILGLIEEHLTKTEVKAILLRYQNQCAIEDVAKKMNVKPRSVSRYISVGFKKIRDILKANEGTDHEEGE